MTKRETNTNPALKILSNECRWLAFNLYDIRRQFGLNQEDFAKKCGVPRITYTKIETGFCNPTLELLLKLSRKTGLSVSELISEPKVKVKVLNKTELSKIEVLRAGTGIKKLTAGHRNECEWLDISIDAQSRFERTNLESQKHFSAFCLNGELEIRFPNRKSEHVKAGDAAHLSCKEKFSILNPSKPACRLFLLASGSALLS